MQQDQILSCWLASCKLRKSVGSVELSLRAITQKSNLSGGCLAFVC